MAASRILVLKRCLSTSPAMSNAIKNVTVVGGGLMGSGIAQVAAQTGHQVTLYEINEEALKKAQGSIQTSLQRVAKKNFKDSPQEAENFVKDSLSRLSVTLNLKDSVKNADLIIEAIIENLELKHKLFSELDLIAPQRTIFASNTSSLSISDIAKVTKRKDRFGGLHFFNPVPVMKLLEDVVKFPKGVETMGGKPRTAYPPTRPNQEHLSKNGIQMHDLKDRNTLFQVIRIPETSDETYSKLMDWGKAVGKTTITCKDTPGFVVNRLLVPTMAEAIRMLERGDASARDIDTAMKLGASHPMGPFELADYVGNDTTKFILDGWHKRFPDNPLFKPIPLLTKMVEEGKLGIKSGEGFYKYNKK